MSDLLPLAPRSATLPIVQPTPIGCVVERYECKDGLRTWIARNWEAEEARLCRLCPIHECRLTPSGMCLVSVSAFVSDADAPLFSVRDFLAAGRPGRDGDGPPH